MIDFGKTAHRLWAFGGLVGLGTLCAADAACTAGSGAFGFALLTTTLREAAPAFGNNLLATDFLEHVKNRLSSDDASFRNHHLSRAVGDALREVLAYTSRDKERIPNKRQRRHLRRTAKRLGQAWPDILGAPSRERISPRVAGTLAEEHLTGLLRGQPSDASPLDRGEWTSILVEAQRRAGLLTQLEPATREAALDDLESLFTKAFRERLKRDHAQGGRAYPALHLQALGELLDLGQETLQATQALNDSYEAASLSLAARIEDKALRRQLNLVDRLRGLRSAVSDLPSRLEQTLASRQQVDELRRQIAELGQRDLSGPRNLLHLKAAPAINPSGASLSAKLHPSRRAIELIGREEEQRVLEDWMGPAVSGAVHSTPLPPALDVRLQVLSGAGGMGKTRLGMELVETATRAGWDAGFADRTALDDLLKLPMGDWLWERPTFVVIDYASQRLDLLKRLLQTLSDRTASFAGRPPLRLLFLERYSGAGLLWWDQLLNPSSSTYGHNLASWYEPSIDLGLQPVGKDDLADRAFDGLTEPDPDPDPGDKAAFLDRVRSLGPTASPLDIQTLALLWTHLRSADSVTILNLYRKYAEREREHLRAQLAASQGLSSPNILQHEPLLWRMALTVSLQQGLAVSRREFEDALHAEAKCLTASPCAGALAAEALAVFLGRADGEGEATIQLLPLLPDKLAEASILDELLPRTEGDPRPPAFDGETERQAWLIRCSERNPVGAATTLMHCAADFYRWHPSLLPTIQTWARADSTPPSAIERALETLPGSWEPLFDLQSFLARKLYDLAQRSPDLEGHDSVRIPAEIRFAAAASELGVSLANLGQPEEALAAFEESVQLYRQLAAARPEAYLHDLARSLSNLGVSLTDLGRPDEALAADEESVQLYRSWRARAPRPTCPSWPEASRTSGSAWGTLGGGRKRAR